MTGGSECFVAGEAVFFVAGGTVCFVTGVAEYFVADVAEWFVGTFLIVPSPFLQMGQCSLHEHFSATCFGFTTAWGITATWGGTSILIVGAGVGVGGIGQSFPFSKMFLEADPVLGKGVPCLTGPLGMSSSGGGLEL